MRRIVLFLVFAAWAMAWVRADVAEEVLALTGARTKVVWVHCAQGRPKGWDAVSPEYELKGFDTKDGKQRVILPGPASYANPCISPDGELVFYTDAVTSTIYVVNWDGTGKREFAKGYVLCTWRHPEDRSQWLYFTANGYSSGPVVRCRIDDPTIRETVWEKEQAAHTLTVSADGTHAGSEFPWPYAGVAVLPNVSWKQYGNGCNGSIAPDNSYRFFHMGEEVGHDGIIMYDDGGANRRLISFRAALGADSWVPRWTNDVRFLTTNSPIGFPDAEIYLGKFDGTFTKVEKWVKVSNEPSQATKACGWIDPGLGQYEGEVPCTIAIPPVLTPGGGWEFDWGDGTKTKGAAGKHTFAKAGSWTITARRGDAVLKGWMNAQPQKAPSVREVRLLDESNVQVVFDERVMLKDAKATLKSKVQVTGLTLDGEGFGLVAGLGGKLGKSEVLRLEGVYDRAQVPNAVKGEVKLERPAWPVNRTGLVFLWETAKRPGSFQYSDNARAFNRTDLRPVRMARYDLWGAMRLAGGVVLAVDGGSGIVSECMKTQEFGFEATITPFNIHQSSGGSGRILGCNPENGDGPNVALCQDGAKLVLAVRMAADRPQVRRVELCALADQAPNHVVVTFAAGKLSCYLNGKLAKETDELKGAL
ncbi:MAG TPA: hypothetical protein VM487_07260, partial [Phycisphaerae bacterium]|nr:hypothetical protein [Phycisphaerae bacterium]